MHRPDRRDPTMPFADAPLKRLYAEVYCFVLTFVFHDGNNYLRKAITLMVILVWMTLEIGSAFGYADLPSQFWYLRGFVGLLLGRMWNIEINSFADLKLPDEDDGE